MANNQPQGQDDEIPIAFFPNPPPFWKNFTIENQERLNQFKQDITSESNEGRSSPQLSASQLLSLPSELRYLVPPEPPADEEEYRVFNEKTKGRGIDEFDNIMNYISHNLTEETKLLSDWKYEQLYPSPPTGETSAQSDWTFDRQQYLLRFIRSILLNYVELLGILAVNPTSEDKDKKLKDMLNLVANAHALVNEYRPHQARETLINMMEDQLEKKRAEVEGVRRMKEKVEETLAEFEKNAPDRATSAMPEDRSAVSEEDKRKEVQRHMWHAMDEILGH